MKYFQPTAGPVVRPILSDKIVNRYEQMIKKRKAKQLPTEGLTREELSAEIAMSLKGKESILEKMEVILETIEEKTEALKRKTVTVDEVDAKTEVQSAEDKQKSVEGTELEMPKGPKRGPDGSDLAEEIQDGIAQSSAEISELKKKSKKKIAAEMGIEVQEDLTADKAAEVAAVGIRKKGKEDKRKEVEEKTIQKDAKAAETISAADAVKTDTSEITDSIEISPDVSDKIKTSEVKPEKTTADANLKITDTDLKTNEAVKKPADVEKAERKLEKDEIKKDVATESGVESMKMDVSKTAKSTIEDDSKVPLVTEATNKQGPDSKLSDLPVSTSETKFVTTEAKSTDKIQENVNVISESTALQKNANVAIEPKVVQNNTDVIGEQKAVQDNATVISEQKPLEENATDISEQKAVEENANVTSKQKAVEENANVMSEPKPVQENANVISEPKAEPVISKPVSEEKEIERTLREQSDVVEINNVEERKTEKEDLPVDKTSQLENNDNTDKKTVSTELIKTEEKDIGLANETITSETISDTNLLLKTEEELSKAPDAIVSEEKLKDVSNTEANEQMTAKHLLTEELEQVHEVLESNVKQTSEELVETDSQLNEKDANTNQDVGQSVIVSTQSDKDSNVEIIEQKSTETVSRSVLDNEGKQEIDLVGIEGKGVNKVETSLNEKQEDKAVSVTNEIMPGNAQTTDNKSKDLETLSIAKAVESKETQEVGTVEVTKESETTKEMAEKTSTSIASQSEVETKSAEVISEAGGAVDNLVQFTKTDTEVAKIKSEGVQEELFCAKTEESKSVKGDTVTESSSTTEIAQVKSESEIADSLNKISTDSSMSKVQLSKEVTETDGQLDKLQATNTSLDARNVSETQNSTETIIKTTQVTDGVSSETGIETLTKTSTHTTESLSSESASVRQEADQSVAVEANTNSSKQSETQLKSTSEISEITESAETLSVKSKKDFIDVDSSHISDCLVQNVPSNADSVRAVESELSNIKSATGIETESDAHVRQGISDENASLANLAEVQTSKSKEVHEALKVTNTASSTEMVNVSQIETTEASSQKDDTDGCVSSKTQRSSESDIFERNVETSSEQTVITEQIQSVTQTEVQESVRKEETIEQAANKTSESSKQVTTDEQLNVHRTVIQSENFTTESEAKAINAAEEKSVEETVEQSSNKSSESVATEIADKMGSTVMEKSILESQIESIIETNEAKEASLIIEKRVYVSKSEGNECNMSQTEVIQSKGISESNLSDGLETIKQMVSQDGLSADATSHQASLESSVKVQGQMETMVSSESSSFSSNSTSTECIDSSEKVSIEGHVETSDTTITETSAQQLSQTVTADSVVTSEQTTSKKLVVDEISSTSQSVIESTMSSSASVEQQKETVTSGSLEVEGVEISDSIQTSAVDDVIVQETEVVTETAKVTESRETVREFASNDEELEEMKKEILEDTKIPSADCGKYLMGSHVEEKV